MTKLCIHDLVTATGGQLRMGMMPPLGGGMAPVGRLVPLGSEIRSGDVILVTAGETTNGIAERSLAGEKSLGKIGIAAQSEETVESSAWALTEAYVRGALGVVSDQDVCPWDGCFSIRVRDIDLIQRKLLEQMRNQTNQIVIAVLDNENRSAVADALRAQVATAGSDGAGTVAVGDLFWQLVQADPTDHAIVLHVNGQDSDHLLQRLRPDVVIAAANATENLIQRTTDLAGDKGMLVLEVHRNGQSAADWRRQAEFATERLSRSWRQVQVADSTTLIQTAMLAIKKQSRKRTERTMSCRARVA